VDTADPLFSRLPRVKYSRGFEFDHGYIQDESLTVLPVSAHCAFWFCFGRRGHWVQYFVVCVLSANSEETVALSFDVACLREIIVWRQQERYVLYSDYFAVP